MDDNQDNNASSRSTVHWGAKNIGPVINQTERQTIHLLQTGQIKCAQKKGGRSPRYRVQALASEVHSPRHPQGRCASRKHPQATRHNLGSSQHELRHSSEAQV